jgi:hypothetical protein
MFGVNCLEIAAMFFAKISVLLLLDRISVQLSAKLIVVAFLAAWAIFSIVASLICHPTPPWIVGQSYCLAQGRLIYLELIFNGLSDAVLALWIVPSTWKLAMPRKSKLLVIFVFGTRIL